MQVGGPMWRKEVLYDIIDGKCGMIVSSLQQDPELKTWKCQQAGDECVGFTLLHGAVRYSNSAALSLLLEHGAVGITAKDKQGKSPLDWAITNGEVGMVSVMLMCAKSGKTAMPNLELTLKKADMQVEAAQRAGTKVAEANETRGIVKKLIDEIEAAKRAEEEAQRKAEAEARRLLEEEMLHFNGLVESSLLRKGIGKDAPIIMLRVRPLSPREYAEDPVNTLGDVDGNPFDESDAPGTGPFTPGLDKEYSLGRRLFKCNSLLRDRDPVYGTADAQYNDADQLNGYLQVGGTIIDSMTKGTNSTVIMCGARGAGKSYAFCRPFHDHPAECDEWDEAKSRWSAGNLVMSDNSGVVERTGRDLMSYRTVLQAHEPSAKLFVAMTCFVVYQEKMYDLLAKTRADVLNSSKTLKVVGQEVKKGAEGRGIFVQGLTQRAIAGEGPGKKKKGAKEKSVRSWLMKAEKARRNLAKDLKAGDKGLHRAACITMFEILQMSEVKKQDEGKGRRGRAGRDSAGAKSGAQNQLLFSSVTFVDLPGAVRVPADDGVKKKEDVAITKMLQCLSNCIDMMQQEQQPKAGKPAKKVVIPWRNSKLTMLLRDKIGGQNLTIMIGAISPAAAELDNSRRTLEFLRICGALRQIPIEEREANISVVEDEPMDQKERDAKAAEKAAAIAAIKKLRMAKRDRGEQVYDEETGELLEDDDDLDDGEGGLSLASLLDDPGAVMATIDDLSGDGGAEASDDGAHLRAHAEQRRMQLSGLPEHAIINSILDTFGNGRFRKQMLEIDRVRLNLLEKLRQREAKHRQLLAELKSVEQVYLEFDASKAGEGSDALRGRLTKALGVKAKTRRRGLKNRSKFLNAFEDLSGKATRAWTTAQLQLIQERCDALVSTQVELGACRQELIPLLKQMHDAIAEQRFEILDAQNRGGVTSTSGEDPPSDPADLELQLHDLGLLTMEVESDMADLSSMSSDELLGPTIDYSNRFGKELYVEVSDALQNLGPAKPTMLSKLRLAGTLVAASGSQELDEESTMALDEEAAARRKEALQEEASSLAALVDPFASLKPAPAEPGLVLTAEESEMSRLAKGLSKAVLAILTRQHAHRLENRRALEERLERVAALAASRSAALKVRRSRRAARAVATGECHTICIRPADGVAFSCGGGTNAGEGIRRLPQLGHGQVSGPCALAPTPVVGLDVAVREVAAGTMHTLLLSADGSVWSCGAGKYGALGHGDGTDVATPRRIEDLSQMSAEQISAGDFHSQVLTSDGNVYSFGWGAGGRLGHGDHAPCPKPQQIAALVGTRICQISAGSTHSLAVGDGGELYAWGVCGSGRLGLGEEVLQNQELPVRVAMPRGVRIWQASAGGSHSLAVGTEGTLYSFGNGGHGRLGHGDRESCWEPTLVRSLEMTAVRHAEAGMAHSVVLTEAGEVLTCGRNYKGWLGHSDGEDRLVPMAVAALAGTAVEDVATGAYHTAVLLASGELRAFGSNKYGQLGAEAVPLGEAGASEPTTVSMPEAVVVLSEI